MSGAGSPPPPAGLAPGTGGAPKITKKVIETKFQSKLLTNSPPPPGRFGIEGAGLEPTGGGGAPRDCKKS